MKLPLGCCPVDRNKSSSAAAEAQTVVCMTIRCTWVCLWMTAAALLSLSVCQSGSLQAEETTNTLCSSWILLVYLEFWSPHRSVNMPVNASVIPRDSCSFFCVETSRPVCRNRGDLPSADGWAERLWKSGVPFTWWVLTGLHRLGCHGDVDGVWFIRGELWSGCDVACKQPIPSERASGRRMMRRGACREIHVS